MEKFTVDQLDILMNKKEAVLAPFRSKMEELKQQFIMETVHFAADWFKKTAKDYITKYPEVALSLSEEKMAQMKAGVNELANSAERNVKKELENTSLWWHQEPHLHDPINKYKQVADKFPIDIDTSIRHVLGRLGFIFESFGFDVSASGSVGSFKEIWFERSFERLEIVPFYPHLLEWTKQMQDIMREYEDLYLEALAIFNEIQLLKEEKKRREALTRWDSL